MDYDLNRFIVAQERDYAIALQEIKSGYKRSHWMWYIFPQISGLGHSAIAKKYEIVDLEEAKMYMENTYLRSNLIEISRALLECDNDDAEEIMGFPDNLKLCSSMTLFEIVAPDIEEFRAVLDKFFDGNRDKRTIELVKSKRKI
ncbi:MAG: DUF1810 domain-containing protein [Lachnospiraceae bacterium]|nr:DUF1810 domain-containing protein [Lachnospiraceae bacterium]